MKFDELKEMRQFVGFLYKCPYDERFLVIYPTDVFTGLIIANNDPSKLKRLISPYSIHGFKDILKGAKRLHILDSKVLGLRPCDEKAGFSREYRGLVESMSKRGETTRYSVPIRMVGDPERFNSICGCDKADERFLKNVWCKIIRDEWNLKSEGIKYYQTPSCPHIWAEIFAVEDGYGVKVFGDDVGFDVHERNQSRTWIKPYLLAFIDILRIPQRFRDIEINYVFTYFTDFFRTFKKYVNKMRKRDGLGSITMYDDPGIKEYIFQRFIRGGYSEDKLREAIWKITAIKSSQHDLPANSLSQA